MEFHDVLFGRRSIRKFREEPVPREVVERLIEAAFAAPIGTRDECRSFIVLTGEAKERLVAEVLEPGLARLAGLLDDCAARDTVRYTQALLPPLRQAPVVIAAYMDLIDRDESLALPTVAAAVENLLLAAHAEGLGACWTTGSLYLAEDIREYLGLYDKQLVALIPLGYPAQSPERSPRAPRVDWRGVADAPASSLGQPEGFAYSLPKWVREGAEGDGAEILVGDWSRSARDSIRRSLTAAGYVVLEADTPDRVVPLVRERPPALVILESFFADGCGADLSGQLREATGGYVPVLLAAGAYHLEDKARALALGADGFVGKPLRWPELLGQVRSLLRTKRLYDDLGLAKRDLERLVQQRDRLTHMIIHDLRSPLAGVVGTMQFVLVYSDSRIDDSARTLLEMWHESGQTLLGMVNDLLDISKMSEVGLPLTIEPVSVHEVATAVVRQLARLALDKRIEVAVEVPEDLRPVPADQQKLQRVLANLVGNALKFTPAEGSVRVTAHVDEAAGTMNIAVSDTGAGIPKQDHARIFEMFAQGETDSAAQRQGTGLGLTFCKMVVEAHGGSITVDSEEGKGSTFTVRLPLMPASAGDCPSPDPASAGSGSETVPG